MIDKEVEKQVSSAPMTRPSSSGRIVDFQTGFWSCWYPVAVIMNTRANTVSANKVAGKIIQG
jgi:hypothetical protein